MSDSENEFNFSSEGSEEDWHEEEFLSLILKDYDTSFWYLLIKLEKQEVISKTNFLKLRWILEILLS